ncbi:hypothetical protein WDW89_06695 [Deltaproteobacteria bacterium TL4]
MGNALQAMVSALKQKASLATQIAQADLSHEVEISSEQDELGKALRYMHQGLNTLLGKIMSATLEIAEGASQIEYSNQSLAEGALKQAGSSEQISTSMKIVAAQTEHNASNAHRCSWF